MHTHTRGYSPKTQAKLNKTLAKFSICFCMKRCVYDVVKFHWILYLNSEGKKGIGSATGRMQYHHNKWVKYTMCKIARKLQQIAFEKDSYFHSSYSPSHLVVHRFDVHSSVLCDVIFFSGWVFAYEMMLRVDLVTMKLVSIIHINLHVHIFRFCHAFAIGPYVFVPEELLCFWAA